MYNSVITSILKFKSSIPAFGISSSLIYTLFILLPTFLFAQGNLVIAPHRIVFEGQKRVMEVNLSNVGQDSAKYNISFIQYRQTNLGGYEDITDPDPDQKFADKNIRIFPRTVMLGPNESQVIRLQLINKNTLDTGEYRSHLYFRAIPNQNKQTLENEKNVDTSAIRVKIVPIFGISIPVLIRVGQSTTVVNIDNLKLDTLANGAPKICFSMHRAGNMSTLGDISIIHIAPNGKETIVGTEKGVAFYTPNTLLKSEIKLENKLSINLNKGTFRVQYRSNNDKRSGKIAESDLVL